METEKGRETEGSGGRRDGGGEMERKRRRQREMETEEGRHADGMAEGEELTLPSDGGYEGGNVGLNVEGSLSSAPPPPLPAGDCK